MPNNYCEVIRFRLSAILLCVAAVLNGCENPASFFEPIIYANRGGMSPQTDFNIFRDILERHLQDELAGKKPPYGGIWRNYWQDRYYQLRTLSKKEPLIVEENINYIHQRRQRLGLPLYDKEKPPPKAIYGM